MGLGREFYEPVARALDGINNQLNLNAKRADDREAMGLKKLLIASQLETQQETNELNRRAAEREDQRLAMAVEGHGAARKQSILDEQRAAARFSQEKKDWNLANQKADIEKQRLTIMTTPKPINVYSYLGDDSLRTKKLFSNPRNIEIVEKMHGEDVQFDPSTGFLTKRSTGKRLMMSPNRYNNLFSPKLMSLPYLITDPAAVIRGDIAEINEKKVVLTEQLKELQTPSNKGIGINFADKAKLKAQIKQLDNQAVAAANTPIDDLIERYREREDKLIKFAIANQYNPHLTSQINLAQTQNKAMLDRLYRKQNALIKKGGKSGDKGFGQDDKWRQIDISLSDYYYDKDETGQYIKNKSQRVRYDRAMNIASKLVKDGVWHMDAVNIARSKVNADEQKYFSMFEKIAANKNTGYVKAARIMQYKKLKSLNGKTYNQVFKSRLGYIPNKKVYLKEIQK